MYITVDRVENDDLLKIPTKNNHKHNVVKNTITEGIFRQNLRYKKDGFFNSSLSSYEVSTMLKISTSGMRLLKQASEKLALSARSYFKTIKVAQTIADLEGAPEIRQSHIAEAISFRKPN